MLDTNLMLKTSGAEGTATGSAKNFGGVVSNQPLTFVASITAKSGTTPTLDLKIEGSPNGSTGWVTVAMWPQVVEGAVPVILRRTYKGDLSYFRYNATVGGSATPLFTYQVGVELGGEYEDF